MELINWKLSRPPIKSIKYSMSIGAFQNIFILAWLQPLIFFNFYHLLLQSKPCNFLTLGFPSDFYFSQSTSDFLHTSANMTVGEHTSPSRQTAENEIILPKKTVLTLDVSCNLGEVSMKSFIADWFGTNLLVPISSFNFNDIL